MFSREATKIDEIFTIDGENMLIFVGFLKNTNYTTLFSMVCICITFILPAPQRKASQKKLMQIAHYRNPHRVTELRNSVHILCQKLIFL